MKIDIRRVAFDTLLKPTHKVDGTFQGNFTCSSGSLQAHLHALPEPSQTRVTEK
jgi:hypothetical protein